MRQFIVWVDQGINLLFGGNIDATISARCYANREASYWNRLMIIVDCAFYPTEGKDHCKNSFESDPEIHFNIAGWRRFLLPIVVVQASILIWIINKISSYF